MRYKFTSRLAAKITAVGASTPEPLVDACKFRFVEATTFFTTGQLICGIPLRGWLRRLQTLLDNNGLIDMFWSPAVVEPPPAFIESGTGVGTGADQVGTGSVLPACHEQG
jgi:hypothetical protein